MEDSKIIKKLVEILGNQLGGSTEANFATPLITKQMLDWLANAGAWDNYGLEIAVARHVNTSDKTLLFLAREGCTEARRSCAARQFLPDKVAIYLSGELEDLDITTSLARNRFTPAPALQKLAQSKYDCVRRLVAGHPKAPQELLERLVKDQDETVRVKAARRIVA